MTSKCPLPVLTNSALQTFKTCPRKFELRYLHGLRRVHKEAPLRIGGAFHAAAELLDEYGLDAALDAVNKAYAKHDDHYEWAKVRAMVRAYAWRWSEDAAFGKWVTKEVTMETSLGDGMPDLAGKFDGCIQPEPDTLALHEIKTRADNCGDDAYWSALRINSQVSTYFYIARGNGIRFSCTLYDVVGKPSYEPYRATPPDKRKYKNDGTLYANMREFDEAPEDYEERLLSIMVESPGRWFARRQVTRLSHEIDEFEDDLKATIELMIRCEELRRYPKNTDACFKWNRRCEYFGLCAGEMDMPTPDACPQGWEFVTDVHPELQEQEIDDDDE